MKKFIRSNMHPKVLQALDDTARNRFGTEHAHVVLVTHSGENYEVTVFHHDMTSLVAPEYIGDFVLNVTELNQVIADFNGAIVIQSNNDDDEPPSAA